MSPSSQAKTVIAEGDSATEAPGSPGPPRSPHPVSLTGWRIPPLPDPLWKELNSHLTAGCFWASLP